VISVPGRKLDPVTVSVPPSPPTVAAAGLIEVTAGAGVVTVTGVYGVDLDPQPVHRIESTTPHTPAARRTEPCTVCLTQGNRIHSNSDEVRSQVESGSLLMNGR
jgi:hypothetical protein